MNATTDRIVRNPLTWAFLAIALVIAFSSIFSVVPETKQALIVRLGNPNRVINGYKPNQEFGRTGAGLIARVPFLEQIVWIDKRVLDFDMDRQSVLSTDQLRLEVDAYARYRIVNPLQMYISAGSEKRVGEALRPILGSALRNELGKRPFAALLSPERGQLMENIQAGADPRGASVRRRDRGRADQARRPARRHAARFRVRADADGTRAAGAHDPRTGRQDRADHPRRRRCRCCQDLCRQLRQGSGIL